MLSLLAKCCLLKGNCENKFGLYGIHLKQVLAFYFDAKTRTFKTTLGNHHLTHNSGNITQIHKVRYMYLKIKLDLYFIDLNLILKMKLISDITNLRLCLETNKTIILTANQIQNVVPFSFGSQVLQMSYLKTDHFLPYLMCIEDSSCFF